MAHTLDDSLFQPLTIAQDTGLKALVLDKPGSYRLKLSDTTQCSFPDSIDIKVQGTAFPAIESATVQTCDHRLLRLQVAGNAPGNYQWLFSNGDLKSGMAVEKELTPKQSKLSFRLIRVINGCLDTIRQEIALDDSLSSAPEPVLPNVVTPNGDGLNDALCFDTYRELKNCFELSIFNRNGTRVFHTTRPSECSQAREIPSGVYYYILQYQNQKVKQFIHVLR